MLSELSVMVSVPGIRPPFSGSAATPKLQLLPDARLTAVEMVEVCNAVVEVVAHSVIPGAFAGLRKPKGTAVLSGALSEVMVRVEPGVPIFVSQKY